MKMDCSQSGKEKALTASQSSSTDAKEVKALMLKVERDLSQITHLLRQLELSFSIESEERELFAQSQVNLQSLIHACVRLKDESVQLPINQGVEDNGS